MSYRLSAQAASHVDAIAHYALARWGVKQADNYLAKLLDALALLANNPYLRKSRPDILPDSRSFRCGGRTVYYHSEADGIVVFAILHQHALPANHIDINDL